MKTTMFNGTTLLHLIYLAIRDSVDHLFMKIKMLSGTTLTYFVYWHYDILNIAGKVKEYLEYIW